MSTLSDKRNVQDILAVVSTAGKTILSSGAEVYRTEDTIRRLLSAIPGVSKINVYVVLGSITVSFYLNEEPYTYLFSVNGADVDLNRISLVNDFSRNFVAEKNTDYKKAIDQLEKISTTKVYKRYPKYMVSATTCGFFTLMFGGGFIEFLFSILIGFVSINIIRPLQRNNISFFLVDFIGALAAGLISNILSILIPTLNMDSLIIGAIMLLVPGMALTNAIRDTMSGDFVSGSSRLSEVIFAALAIALGVYVAHKLTHGGIFIWTL